MDWWIEKKTGTYAETLEAIGLASAVRELGFRGVRITDQGSQFRIQAAQDPAGTYTPPFLLAGFPYIWERSKEPKPRIANLIDYEGEREKNEAAKRAGKKAKAALESQDVEPGPEARPEFGVAAILASMRNRWNSDRDLAKWVDSQPQDAANWVRFRLGLGGKSPGITPVLTNTQILNPISGKGVHAGKTEIRSAGSIPGQLVDSFSEWMKLRGLWGAMLLYRSDDDFKFFVIEPADIQVDELEKIRVNLQGLRLWGGVRLDIQAALNCASILIRQSDALQDGQMAVKVLGRRPREVVAGLRQAYFKSLGTAAALMNDAFLPLPDWFAIKSREDARDFLRILDEVTTKGGCLNSLQEKNSDDGHVLQQYREWLLSGDLTDLLEFHYRFALHLAQRLSRNEWARPFGTENLTMLLTKAYDMTEIIEDAGFQSVARALRNATLYALTLPNLNREVRFGIAQKWKQKMKSGEGEFAGAVAEFVQDYNWETAYRLKGKGHSVTTDDLDSLLHLIQKRGAELVGCLLLAYGYARAPKVETGQPEELTLPSQEGE